MKTLRWLLLVLVVLALPVVLAPLIPLNALRPAAQARLSDLFQREVEIGSLRLSLLGGPYLMMKRVTVKKAPEFGGGNLFEAERVSANLVTLPLLRGNIVIEKLVFDSPQLWLVRNNNGLWNWMVSRRPTTAVRSRHPMRLMNLVAGPPEITTTHQPEEFEVRNASVWLLDGVEDGATATLYRNVNLKASLNSAPETTRISGVLRVQSGADGGEPLTLEAPFDLTRDRADPALAFNGYVGPAEVETAGIAAQELTSAVSLREREFVLDQLATKLYDGTMRGRVAFDLANDRFTAAGTLDHLNLDNELTGKLQIPGAIKGHINADFDLRGRTGTLEQVFQTWQGEGRISSGELTMSGFNVSGQMAAALRISEIGAMSAGTDMAGVTGRFRLGDALLSAEDFNIEMFDGLGQARIERGGIKFGDEPEMNFIATVTLSPDATERVKAASLLLGAITTWFEREKRLTIPVSITGSVRDPQVRVDVRLPF